MNEKMVVERVKMYCEDAHSLHAMIEPLDLLSLISRWEKKKE